MTQELWCSSYECTLDTSTDASLPGGELGPGPGLAVCTVDFLPTTELLVSDMEWERGVSGLLSFYSGMVVWMTP